MHKVKATRNAVSMHAYMGMIYTHESMLHSWSMFCRVFLLIHEALTHLGAISAGATVGTHAAAVGDFEHMQTCLHSVSCRRSP